MKTSEPDNAGDLHPEYNLKELLKGGVRGKYASKYAAGSNVILLEPDVLCEFRDGEAVNDLAPRDRRLARASNCWIENASNHRAYRVTLFEIRRCFLPMYSENIGNGSFRQPFDDSSKTWRYLSFSAFVSMLQTRQIFCCRLGHLKDPYEGTFTDATRARFPEHVAVVAEKWTRRNLCVNCWHMSEYESAAMWAIYSEGGKGIAISSTVGRMKKALQDEPRDVSMCEVEYVDFSQSNGSEAYFSLNLKRRSFEYEREVRLWLSEVDHSNDQEYGTKIRVDLEEMVDQIYVSPEAEPWLKGVVDREMQAYNLDRSAIRSELYSPVVR